MSAIISLNSGACSHGHLNDVMIEALIGKVIERYILGYEQEEKAINPQV